MSFENALADHGLMPKVIEPDGKWYRCATVDKPKKRNGAYLLQIGGHRGYFKNFATDDDYTEWKSGEPVTAADQRKMDERIRALREKEAQAQARAVVRMRQHWATLGPLRDWHAYVEHKGLTLQGCQGLRVDGDDMVIPMYRAGSLISLQHITMDGQKKYRAGCPTRGASYVMSRSGSTVSCFVEGFATGLAVFQSVARSTVIVCFDANNLITVATERKVKGLAVVCADNDWQTAARTGSNKGVESGTRAAARIGCGVAYPSDIEGSDWADALKEWGEAGRAKVQVEVMRGAKVVF